MSRRMRRVMALAVFAVASVGVVATTPAYTLLASEQSEVISLAPDGPAALRSFTVALSAAALPDIDGILASRTYGQVVVAIADDAPGVEVAVAASGTSVAPAFVPAGEHVVFDAADCALARDCRRSIDLVVRLVEGAAATDLTLTVRSGVYYPAASLPDGAALTFGGLDVPARPVSVHAVDADLSGEAQLDPARPLDIVIHYAPASGTLLRLHGGQLSGTYDPGALPNAGESAAGGVTAPVLDIGLRRGADTETLRVAAFEDLAQPITPLAVCLASCDLTYRLVLTPRPAPTDPSARLTWQARAWVFVLTEPGGTPPRLEMEALQPPGD